MNHHPRDEGFYQSIHQCSSHDDQDNTEEDEQGGISSIYLGNIAAACQSVNADCKKQFRSEPERREERRLANRRRAKMSRDRKNMERKQLQEKAKKLSQSNLDLAQENEYLRTQVNILLQQQNQHDNPHISEGTQQVHNMLQNHTQSGGEDFRQNMNSNNTGITLNATNDLLVQQERLWTQFMLHQEQEEKQSDFSGLQAIGTLEPNNIFIGGMPGFIRNYLGASDGQNTVTSMSRRSPTDAGFDNFEFDYVFSSNDGNQLQRRDSD